MQRGGISLRRADLCRAGFQNALGTARAIQRQSHRLYLPHDRFTGSSSHDELYINGTHLAKLLNSEYAFMEVPAGTVVISGLPKEYYGTIIMSAAAAANQARQKENERARFEAQAGKTYYFKWTAGAFATGIKVTPEDPDVGAKEIHKLHLSKPVDDKEEAKPGAEPAKPEESAKPAEAPKSDQSGKPN